jgi:hypothetical protein
MAVPEYNLRYLRGTFDKSLRFSRDYPIVDTFWGWLDSDWAGDTDTLRSHTAYIMMYADLYLESHVARILLLSLRGYV